MSNLELEACPICQERDSLVAQEVDLGDRTLVSYECLDCSSVLVWLGDDLWLEADRWAYHKVGRPALSYLLHRSITVPELEAMARGEAYPEPAAPAAPPAPSRPRREPPVIERVQERPPVATDRWAEEPLPTGPVIDAEPEPTPEVEPVVMAKPVAPEMPEPEPDLLVMAEAVPEVEAPPDPELPEEAEPWPVVLAEPVRTAIPEPEPDLQVMAESVPEVEHAAPLEPLPTPEPEVEPVVLAEAVPSVVREPEPDLLVMAEPVPDVEPAAAPAPQLPAEVEPGPVVMAEPVVSVVPEPEPDLLVMAEAVVEVEPPSEPIVDPEEAEPDLLVVTGAEPPSVVAGGLEHRPEATGKVRRTARKGTEDERKPDARPAPGIVPGRAAEAGQKPDEGRPPEPARQAEMETEESRPWLARVLEPRRRRPAQRDEQPSTPPASKPEAEPGPEEERSWLARVLEPRSRRPAAGPPEAADELAPVAVVQAEPARKAATRPARVKERPVRRATSAATKAGRSRGSPFLVISISFVFLCLVCTGASMIAWSMFGPDVERMVGPAGQPIGEGVVESGRATTVAEQPAPDAAPAEVPVVSFQGVTGFYGGDGAYFLVGEALNASDQNLRFVEVRASFSDGGGEVVGTGSAFVELGIVEAGSIAPFELVLLDPPRSLAGFQLRADYLTTGQSLIGLEMVRESASRDSAGRHQIAGEVRNPHEFAVKLPEVVVTYYDARHDVVAVETAFTDLETLEPGESSPFLVVLAELPATFQSYSLLTEAARE